MTVADMALWVDGPPHELFAEMRGKCPVHWSSGIAGMPGEVGFWSITRAADLETVSRDWKTFSSHLQGSIDITEGDMPEELREMSHLDLINLDPPKHDRLKALFLQGFTAPRIAEHEAKIKEIVTTVLDRLDGRETCDLVSEVSQPIVARVIHSFMGIPEEDDLKWAGHMKRYLGRDDPDLNPGGIEEWAGVFIPQLIEEAMALIEPRRAEPTDDLISILVHAEIDGERLTDEDIVMGILLLFAAGNDSTM
ncbi:cytochrome P450, partial [Streptacidiphilus pinicola]